MSQIHIIDQLEITNVGVEACFLENKKHQEVFLNQGSLDGACGPYSVFMALLALGLVDREPFTSFANIDLRTRAGKLLRAMNEGYTHLFREGTDLDQLQELLQNTFGSLIEMEQCDLKSKEAVSFIEDHVSQDHPVITGIHFPGGAHWVVCVGAKYRNEELIKLMALDPSGTAPSGACWNSVLEASPSKRGKYPYFWLSEDSHVMVEDALALWTK